jgi:signal transduction histidine kinase
MMKRPIDTTVPKKNHGFFLKSFKKIGVELIAVFVLNLIVLYTVLFFVPNSSLAMVGTVWVMVLGWRGGIGAGIIGTVVIYFSSFISMHIPPHQNIPIEYFFNGRVPGFVIGSLQALAGGLIVGYISTLVHKLRSEIALRKAMQIDLEQKVAELNTFGHTVAHDLKNPLMIINMAITNLVSEAGTSENAKAEKMITFIQNSSASMMNIIESLLTFAGIRSIGDESFTRFPVVECVNSALHRLAFFLESNKVNVLQPDAWPHAYGYAPWITEVFVNYISNAIKYGGQHDDGVTPQIELGYDLPGSFSSDRDGHVRFWVRDNGDGIPEENMDALFKEFSRLHSSKHEGHGLGLSIVKAVVDKLDGTVGVVPNEVRGSRFYFTLPAKKQAG